MAPKIINLPHNRPLIAKANRNHHRLPKKVAVLYSEVKREYFPTERQYLTEKDAEKDAAALVPYLNGLGVEAVLLPADTRLTARLRHQRPEMVINLVESVRGCEYLSSTVPATLELLEIPYTGASMLGHTLCMNKYITKDLLLQHGIPVPRFQLFTSWRQRLDPSLKFPIILKLNEVHGSLEITRESIIETDRQLRSRLHWLMKTYDQDVLAEEFIEGREFAAFVFQAYNRKVYTIERVFSDGTRKNKYNFLDFDLVWKAKPEDYFNRVGQRKYHDPLLSELVRKAFLVVNMDDYGKFDIRLDRQGKYYFIDSNPNCYFAPPKLYCDLTMTLKLYGVSFRTLLKKLLINTMREWS
jgi:D-alanine-D-alanine ligase